MAHKELNEFSEHISFFLKATGLMLLYVNCPFITADSLHACLTAAIMDLSSGHCVYFDEFSTAWHNISVKNNESF